MIDERIPDLQDPKLRALYDSLLGRREPTWPEKAVLLAVASHLDEAAAVLGVEMDRIYVVIERAWRLDRDGVIRRFNGWLAEATKRADERANSP